MYTSSVHLLESYLYEQMSSDGHEDEFSVKTVSVQQNYFGFRMAKRYCC